MIFFSRDEFNCPCCGMNGMQDSFLGKLDIARGEAGVPFVITSGYRCVTHNKAVGGKITSSHMDGWAADIEAKSSRQRYRIIRGLIKAKINRIGIGKTFIHADDDPDKDPEVVWLYK